MRTKRQSACISAFRRTPLVAALACAFIAPSAMAQAFDPNQLVVTNTSGSAAVAGSLPYAINYANSFCGTVPNPTITFAIPATGPFVISPSATLPQFYCPASNAYNPTINGASQPGFVPNSSAGGFNSQPMIVVDGSVNYGGSCALSLQNNGYGGTLTVKGLEIRNWTYGGFQTGVCGTVNLLGNRVTNMYSGADARNNSTIGGPGVADRNVFANMGGTAIRFDGATAIVNNLIGTADGSTASPVDTGIEWCFCTQPSGIIVDNVIVANYTGIEVYYDNAMLIKGNRIGTDSSGANLIGLGSYGISINYSYGATIRDNVIAGQDNAIDNYNGSNVLILANRLGTNAAGNAALGNTTGIYDSYTYGTRIESNLVSGSSDTGIYLSNAQDTMVVANLVGTDGSGGSALPNFWGIFVGGGLNVTVDGNTISGNDVGIYLSAISSATVSNNRIGTQSSGAGSVPNNFGAWADCGSSLTFNANRIANNTTGGLGLWGIQNSAFSSNNIAANGGHGVEASYTNCGFFDVLSKATKATMAKVVLGMNESDLNLFTGNVISGNAGKGLFIQGGNRNNIFQNSVNGNLIDGVRIDSHYDAYGAVISAGVGNSIVENLIYGNGAKNINLAFDGGPLPNDPGDADTNKPNNWQNRPVIASATRDTLANTTTMSFSLDSKAGEYRIDFFANPSPGAPAGRTYLGNTFLVLGSDANMAGSYSVGGLHDYISAVATRVGPVIVDVPTIMDSSEFADIVAATTLPVPGVSVLPSSINFGDVVVGRSSGASTVTISSTGTAPYVISALRDASCAGPPICSTGSFVCTTTCAEATPYSAGNSCVINASFAPTAPGSQTKTLALCDNVVGSPRTITFTGNGVPPPTVDIAMSPASWSFGQVLVGLQSAPKRFTTSNAGTTQVYLGPVSVTGGDFIISGNTCGPTLAPGASCATDVTFVPASNGVVFGSVQVTGSNTPTAPAALRAKVTTSTTTVASARLDGSGIQFGDLRLPASLSFGSIVLHSALAQQTVQLTNTGNGPLALGTISVAGPFTLDNACGASLAVGASCNVTVGFNPAALGSFNGTLTIISDAPGGSRAIALSATVIADPRPVVRVNTTTVGFGDRVIGSQSPAQRVIVTNEGAQVAALGAMSFTQPESAEKQEFSISGSTCAGTLGPQATCVVDLVFKPLGFGTRAGQLIVPSNSADSPRTVTLGGTGCRPPAAGGNRSGRDPCAQ